MSDRLSTAQKRKAAAEARRRRQALGPPLDADIDQASTVSVTDQPEALAFARSVAGERAVDMLEAQ